MDYYGVTMDLLWLTMVGTKGGGPYDDLNDKATISNRCDSLYPIRRRFVDILC